LEGGKGGVIERLAVWPSVIHLLCSALTATHWARQLQCLQQTCMGIFCAVNV